MKVYVTKYALSTGICVQNAQAVPFSSMIQTTSPGSRFPYLMGKNDYCVDADSAIACADIMRDKKIASLKKQIERLEKLDFHKQIEKAEAMSSD